MHAFSVHGLHTTAVDALLAESGISKRSVYRYFPTKEALIAEVVGHYHKTFISVVREHLAKRANLPATSAILSLFSLPEGALRQGNFKGCFAMNTKVEFDGKSEPIESACAQFYSALQDVFHELCESAGCHGSKKTAEALLLTFMGCVAHGKSTQSPTSVRRAAEVTQLVIENALSKHPLKL